MIYGKLLKYYLVQQRWARLSVDETQYQQILKFCILFEYARIHSPFYRNLYREAGVGNLEIRTFEDIQKVPAVDKSMMRNYDPEEIMTYPITPELVQVTTSGSTGEPFKIYLTKFEQYTSHMRLVGMLASLGCRPWHLILMLWRLDPDAFLPIEQGLSNGEKFAHHHAHAIFLDFTECIQFEFVQTHAGQIILHLKIYSGVEELLVREKALARWNHATQRNRLKSNL